MTVEELREADVPGFVALEEINGSAPAPVPTPAPSTPATTTELDDPTPAELADALAGHR